VNVAHINKAVRGLIDEVLDNFLGFHMTFTILRSAGHDELRAYARNFSEKQKERYVVKYAWYDILRSLKGISKELTTKQGQEPTAKQLADCFAGGKTEPTPLLSKWHALLTASLNVWWRKSVRL